MRDEARIAEAMRAYLCERAPVLVLRLDPDGRVAEINPLAATVLGDGIVGRPLLDCLLDFPGTLDLAALLAAGGNASPLTFKTAAGMPETLSFQFHPMQDGTLALGSLDFREQQNLRDEVLGLNRELNNITRQLHLANAELRDLSELKNRFIGMAAHDLRIPIGVIMVFADFLLEEAGDRLEEKQRGFLRTVLAAASGMKQLIDNFLDVSVIEAGQLRLEPSRSDAAGILSGVLPLIGVRAARKRIEILVDTGGDSRPLRADVLKLQQVLVNLASNAIEHSEAGARVWLAARWNGAELVFSVRDEGPGLTPEDQVRLFAPFARAGTRKTAGERSVGLGLAIARLIVDAHGGSIWIESAPGHGATFLFAIPDRKKTQRKETASQ